MDKIRDLIDAYPKATLFVCGYVVGSLVGFFFGLQF
jgi:hypothetical protein